jgi:NAD(P)-dependent dehydrogenase (short-subunit alcohol dehydrogenase family)
VLRLPELFSLEHRVAVVTGGYSGIGGAIASAMAEAGAAVVLVARNKDALARAAAAINHDGGRAAAVACNLADRNALAACAEQVAVPFGTPDIVVHAAATNLRPPLGELTPEEWDQTLRLNLDAPFLLSQALAPAMIARGWGRIIHIASQQAVRAFGHSGAYGVSKAGIAQLARAQAEAWSRHGVTANAIAPGFVRTPLTESVFDDPARAAALAARTFVGRNGTPDDYRGVAVFLASPAADFITGQTIFVDGGFSAS